MAFKALISGAGWKGGRIATSCPNHIPTDCPELLMPIGGGETTVSRLVYQMRKLGADEIYVAIGWPDTFYDDTGNISGVPVWSWKRVAQVRKLGVITVPINSPIVTGSRYQTMHQLLLCLQKRIVRGDQMIVLAGDYVFNTDYLKVLKSTAVWPSILWLLPMHGMSFLTFGGRERFLKWVAKWRDSHGYKLLSRQSVWKGRASLAAAGIKSIELDEPEQQRIAPQIGLNSLSKGYKPLFAELSPDRASWDAIHNIVRRDPCHD